MGKRRTPYPGDFDRLASDVRSAFLIAELAIGIAELNTLADTRGIPPGTPLSKEETERLPSLRYVLECEPVQDDPIKWEARCGSLRGLGPTPKDAMGNLAVEFRRMKEAEWDLRFNRKAGDPEPQTYIP